MTISKSNNSFQGHLIFFGSIMLLYTVYYWYSKENYMADIKFYEFANQSGRSKTKLVNLPLHLLDKNFGKSIALSIYTIASVFCIGVGIFHKKR